MADFRVKKDFFEHPKTKKLTRILGEGSVLCLLRLWGHAAENKWTGELNNMDVDDIEIAANWNGERGLFVQTLLTIRFLDQGEDFLCLHDWEEHNGYAAKTGERKNIAKRASEKRWENFREKGPKCSQHPKTMLTASKNDAHSIKNECSGASKIYPPLPLPSPEEEELSLLDPPVAPPCQREAKEPDEEGREELSGMAEAAKIFKTARAEFEAAWPEAPKTVSHTSLMLYDLAEMAARDPTRRTADFWRSLAQRARASPFLRGEKPGSREKYFPGMKFGWFVKPDTVAQILNGNFDETKAAKSPPSSAPRKEYPDGIKPLGFKQAGKDAP